VNAEYRHSCRWPEAKPKFARELICHSGFADAPAIYRALGWGMVIHTAAGSAVVWRAKRLYRPVGDIMQVGGDFIVDGAGLVRFAHSSADPTDRPEAEELLRLIADLK
jgi:hypothetical protein